MHQVLGRATRYWDSERQSAIERLATGFLGDEYTLLWVRGRIPPLPLDITLEDLTSAALRSRWQNEGPKSCAATGSVIDMPGPRLELSSTRPVIVRLDGDRFHRWPASSTSPCTNLVAVLAMAWCYVLSAKWLEANSRPAPVSAHMEPKSATKSKSGHVSAFHIRTGFQDVRRLLWLSSILSSDGRNIFSFTRSDGSLHQSPWSVSFAKENHLSIIACEDADFSMTDGLKASLTSSEAIGAIRDLCAVNRIPWMQIEASLGIALPVPLHRALGFPLALPPPTEAHTCLENPPDLHLNDLDASLPSLMTSAAATSYSTRLCAEHSGMLQCRAIFSARGCKRWADAYDATDIPSRPDQLFALMGAQRAPSVGIFFIAAAVTGLLPTVYAQICTGQPPLEKHACIFTGVLQSFIDVAGSGDYSINKESGTYLRRSDYWRLRRLPPPFDDDLHYGEGPFAPWEPPGEYLASNCPL